MIYQKNGFKVGDIVKGTPDNNYSITNSNYIGKVTNVNENMIELDDKYAVEAKYFKKIK